MGVQRIASVVSSPGFYVIGITLGVMALVTVLSVMNGFERELQNNILGLMPQAILSSEHGSLNPQQLPETAVKLDGVNRVAPITTGDVVLQSARSVAVGVMLGIDPAQKDPLTPYLVNVNKLTSSRGNIMSSSVNSLPHSWASIAVIKSA